MFYQMSEIAIAFLSNKKDNLAELIDALSTSANNSLIQYGFDSKPDFLEFIENSAYEKKNPYLNFWH